MARKNSNHTAVKKKKKVKSSKFKRTNHTTKKHTPTKRRRRRIQTGSGRTQDKVADAIGTGIDVVSMGLTAAGPVGWAAQIGLELGKMVLQKAIKADYTQTKKREFDKAYEPVRSTRTGRIIGYNPRKNPEPNRYSQDYDQLY